MEVMLKEINVSIFLKFKMSKTKEFYDMYYNEYYCEVMNFIDAIRCFQTKTVTLIHGLCYECTDTLLALAPGNF